MSRYWDVSAFQRQLSWDIVAFFLLAASIPGVGFPGQADQTSEMFRVEEAVYLSALPFLRDLHSDRIEFVIDLRYPYEGVYEDLGALRSQGIEVLNMSVSSKGPTLDDVKHLDDVLAAHKGRHVLIHDSNGHRTATLWGAYRLWKGKLLDQAVAEVRSLYDSPDLRRKLEQFRQETIAGKDSAGVLPPKT